WIISRDTDEKKIKVELELTNLSTMTRRLDYNAVSRGILTDQTGKESPSSIDLGHIRNHLEPLSTKQRITIPFDSKCGWNDSTTCWVSFRRRFDSPRGTSWDSGWGYKTLSPGIYSLRLEYWSQPDAR